MTALFITLLSASQSLVIKFNIFKYHCNQGIAAFYIRNEILDFSVYLSPPQYVCVSLSVFCVLIYVSDIFS